ncbi:MAG TPA: ATPase, partial [Leeuwenhoekiella sp.]|nr:ATPase [Leeuwenhoekiella sp.]
YKDATQIKDDFVLYDRGIPDVPAYMDYAGQDYPSIFVEACKDYRYDRIFVLPPWEDIHQVDNERYEDFATARALHNTLLKTYERYGYSPIAVPHCSVQERVEFIENQLKR